MEIAWLGSLIVAVWNIWEVQVVTYHITLNLAVALAAAIRTNTFEFAKVAEFLYRKMLPYLIVFIVASTAGASLGMAWLATAVWALIEMSLMGDLVDNLKKLGIPIPDGVVRVFKREEE